MVKKLTFKNPSKRDLLKEIKEEVVNFKESPLYNHRTDNKFFPVIGEGNHDAEILFIGEAPGKREAQTGRPFCGRAGKILDEMLDSVEIKREDVYITNIVKDRPPENRDPLPEEIEAYADFIDRQIKIIQPKIIVGLGRFSSHYLLKKFNLEKEIKPISSIHSKVFKIGNLKIIPFFHPASAIYDQRKRDNLVDGFKIIKQEIYK